MFAACDLSTDVDIILCASVVNQLDELEAYNVPKCSVEAPAPVSVTVVTTIPVFLSFSLFSLL